MLSVLCNPPTACLQDIMLHSSKTSSCHFRSESLPQKSLLSPPPLLPPSHCTHPLLLLGELPDSRLSTRNIKYQKSQYSSSSTSSSPSPQLKPQNSHGPDSLNMGEMMQKTVLNEAEDPQLRGYQEEVQGCCHAESSPRHLPACAGHLLVAVEDLVSEVLREEVR
jgi:hypothetical protein